MKMDPARLHLGKVRNRRWSAAADDTSTWRFGDVWPYIGIDEDHYSFIAGLVFVCPYELVEGMKHRHWWLFQRGTEDEFKHTGTLERALKVTQSPVYDAANDFCPFKGRISKGAWIVVK